MNIHHCQFPHLLGNFTKYMAALFVAIGTLGYGECTRAQTTTQPQMNLPRIQLSAGMHLINAQVASTPLEREIGLMHRTEMPVNEGMIFVFENPSALCFWMKNTHIPLTAAFIADDGSIINLADMKPMTTESHCAKVPARFVLEMNQGWFSKRGVREGQKISGPIFKGR